MTEFKLEEKMISDLIEIINDVDWQGIANKIRDLQVENQKLKTMINGFINGVEKDENITEIKLPHICEYTTLLNEYQNWLEKEKDIIYRDCGHTQNAMIKCYDKIKELRKKYE